MIYLFKSSFNNLLLNLKIELLFTPWILEVNFSKETISISQRKWYLIAKKINIISFRFIKEIKINEYKTDEILLQYGNNFKKITNLLRNREWTVFENKKEILAKIETTVDLIHHYLYSKIQKNE